MSKANEVVDYALTQARQYFHRNCLGEFDCGYVLGQLLVAECDLHAPSYIVEGARNEIWYLREISRGRK